MELGVPKLACVASRISPGLAGECWGKESWLQQSCLPQIGEVTRLDRVTHLSI